MVKLTVAQTRFKICEPGDNKPILGLENLPGNHAQIMMLVSINEGKTLHDLQIGESLHCREGGKGVKGSDKRERVEHYDIVRTE